ncbi:unnamed protein product [Amoebophrya sp. A120]|nr:unnamed protein product [Amoebophrya sp. A120]|eukprot:GSA120T00002370001.1
MQPANHVHVSSVSGAMVCAQAGCYFVPVLDVVPRRHGALPGSNPRARCAELCGLGWKQARRKEVEADEEKEGAHPAEAGDESAAVNSDQPRTPGRARQGGPHRSSARPEGATALGRQRAALPTLGPARGAVYFPMYTGRGAVFLMKQGQAHCVST